MLCGMSDVHPINRALLTVLDNQIARTEAAFEGLEERTYLAEPGGECNSIQRIARHLVLLRRFQMQLLESPLAERVVFPEKLEPMGAMLQKIRDATELVREAVLACDPDDWYASPATPREGRWGDEPTIQRFIRPFNDFTNHLGAIRAIRRILGNPNERVQ
jgi:hypothetical protein